ncbi:MAG: cytochrome P450 [Dehalococcoidia bacterium]|nr:cytochrome P450 [Dehalococcoidia bacterium]
MAFFNPFRPSYLENPYPALHRLRAEDPVFRSRELDAWLLTRYEDCLEVLRDDDRFVSDGARAGGGFGEHVRGLRARSPLGEDPLFGQTDPPVHTRLRAIINRAFTPRVVEAERPAIEREAEALLSGAEPGQPFEFMAAVAERLPVHVIGDLLGLNDDNRDEVRRWAMTIMFAASDEKASAAARRDAVEAKEHLQAFLVRFAEEYAGEADRRLIRILLEAGEQGDRLSPEELLSFTVFLYTAGNGPTALLLANGLNALVQHPEQAALLRNEPSLMGDAIDEMLRWDSPTQALVRVVAQDTTIGGRVMKAGDTIFAMVGAANRDPAVFPDPDRFDITRSGGETRHLSFGYGPHFCLGAPLARIEAAAVFRPMLERFPSMYLATTKLERADTLLMRGPRRLPLVLG